jgi:hypothetical protein
MTSFRKSRFLMPRHHPKKSALRRNFLGLRPRKGVALGRPAESEIRPADQTGKLSAGLHSIEQKNI